MTYLKDNDKVDIYQLHGSRFRSDPSGLWSRSAEFNYLLRMKNDELLAKGISDEPR
jgi:hypothetical protein